MMDLDSSARAGPLQEPCYAKMIAVRGFAKDSCRLRPPDYNVWSTGLHSSFGSDYRSSQSACVALDLRRYIAITVGSAKSAILTWSLPFRIFLLWKGLVLIGL